MHGQWWRCVYRFVKEKDQVGSAIALQKIKGRWSERVQSQQQMLRCADARGKCLDFGEGALQEDEHSRGAGEMDIMEKFATERVGALDA